MHAAVKVVIGIILLLIGLGLFVDSVYGSPITGVQWLENFVIVLTGIIPIFLILIGLFVIWLEVDEMKAEKDFKLEEDKEKTKAAIKPAKTTKKTTRKKKK